MQQYYPKILFVDDDPRYAKPLQERAYTFNYLFTHYEDWEEAKSELERNYHKYSAIVLDAQGKLNQDDQGDNPQHITKALRELAELKGKGQAIPHCILTGYFDRVSNYIDAEINIFKKNSEEELMFNFLDELTMDSEKMIVAKKYPETMSYLDEYFLDDQIESFVNLYSRELENSRNSIKEALNKLRVLNERNMDCCGIFEGIAEPKNYVEYLKGTGVNITLANRVKRIRNHFSNNVKRMPSAIFHNIGSIQETASAVASHSASDTSEDYFPSVIQVNALMLGLIESINWVGGLLKTNNKCSPEN